MSSDGLVEIMMMVVISIMVGWRQLGIFRGDLDGNDENDHFEEDAEITTNHDDLDSPSFPWTTSKLGASAMKAGSITKSCRSDRSILEI